MKILNALLLTLAAPALTAQVPGLWVQAQGALLSQRNSACVKNAAGFGASLGQWRSPRWGWEGGFLTSTLKDKDALWKARETHLDGSALWAPLGDAGPWRPFLRGGAGISFLQAPLSLGTSAARDLNLLAGLGFHYTFQGKGLGSAEVRMVSLRSSTVRTEIQVLAGAGVRL